MRVKLPFDDEPYDDAAPPEGAEAMRGRLDPGKRRAYVLAGKIGRAHV